MTETAPTSQTAANGSAATDAVSVIVVGYSAKPEGRAALRRELGPDR